MELYLFSQQLECGAWQAWPGGGPDLDVTAVCVFALKKAGTEQGRQARHLAETWLSEQPLPAVDAFWKGTLAVNGELGWAHVPYFTLRLVSNPDWMHPNIYDFSHFRIGVVSTALLQATAKTFPLKNFAMGGRQVDNGKRQAAFIEWKDRLIRQARKPDRGFLSVLCGTLRILDSMLPIDKHRQNAIDWLLMHQEDDGSFFSSVHMTSIAILALHRLDSLGYKNQIEAGLEAMHKWQVKDDRGRRQQFTDSTTWDTILCMDLLRRLGVTSDDHRLQRARDYIISSQNASLGDWSHRVRNPSAGGWGFQRVGKLYPDNDDTVMAITSLLDLGHNTSDDVVRNGVRWLLAMQSSNGGWASWDRDDRSWMRIPNGGPWFARDLASTEITARILILLSRIVRGRYQGFEDLVPAARDALRRGRRWLKRNKHDGLWFGRWFTHYLYGLCHALEAYRELGYTHDELDTDATVRWLTSVANADGGFGEAPDSGSKMQFVSATSTPFHTACALTSLIHAGAWHHPVAQRAAAWLLGNQNASGSWTNKDFFAAGVPGLWYANFALTPTYFAAKSLLLFKQSWYSSGATLADGQGASIY
jgi:squalene-hopene/tetraprenyl-beta-curcumene cyclase